MQISEKLATNIAMEVNAAISRIMSVIWLSCSLMFLICSAIVLLSTGFFSALLAAWRWEKSMFKFVLIAGLALSTAFTAQAEQIDPARIVDAANWDGDGRADLAMLVAPVDSASDDQIGIYIYLRDADHELLRLSLSAPNKIWGSTSADGVFGQEPSLKAVGKSSIAIHSQNSAIGRDRWDQTLTIAYRNKQFVVAGYTYNHYDTLDPNAGSSCDYNALAGKLQKNGKDVKTEPRVIPIAQWNDDTGQSICGQ
ncbi:hypothetical protein J2W42_004632 [Rhizobium tibeticum]|nr:hypothetical protein [Rhizobium tibeticum]